MQRCIKTAAQHPLNLHLLCPLYSRTGHCQRVEQQGGCCRYESPVVLARNETAESVAGLMQAKATCACWIGGQGICFAVGYSTSDICIWGVPPPVQQGQFVPVQLLNRTIVCSQWQCYKACKQASLLHTRSDRFCDVMMTALQTGAELMMSYQ